MVNKKEEQVQLQNEQLKEMLEEKSAILELMQREADIEVALEKVRARAMAMQKSDELKELIGTVFTELTKLDFVLTRCLIMIYDPATNGSTWWMANSEAPSDPIGLYIKYHEHTTYLAYIKAWKERDLKWQYVLEGTVKKEWDDFLFVETELSHLPDFVIAGMKAPDKVFLNASFNSFGNLTLATLEPLSNEHFDILLRFAKVFDLTYTRFNDLLKAEAQAREGQIQLAMERVRARTMAMQHSDELKNAAALLFQQVKALGAPAYSCGYNIWDKDDKEFTSWMSTQDGSEINGVPNIPLTEDANFIRYVESKKKGEQFFVLELRGERMHEHYDYLKTIPAFKGYFEYAISVGFDLPETQIHHLANFSQGNLLFITLEPCPEFHDVFKRFAAVFEQTYTRFLDLQKAETQAREAEIELGLERVRARGMAMQKSDELAQLVDTVFKELTKLHILLDRCIIRIEDPKTNGSTWWLANPETGSVPLGLFVKYNEYPLNLDYIKAWKARTLKWEYILEGTNKKEYDSFAFSETELSRLPVSVIAGMRSYDRIFLNVSFNNFGSLTVSSAEPLPKEQFDVLLRFAKVFESTYTRFNDLKQVEAQAKEAQIELALERVRARTMAMQRSDELREAVLVIYEQLQQLNFDSKACNIIIVDKETGSAQYWVSGFSQDIFPESYTVPYLNHPYQDMLFKPWKQGDKYVVYEYTGKMKQSFDEIFFTQTEFRNVPEEAKKVMIGLESVMLSTAFISYGALQAIGAEALSEEKANILKRFAKVFEQTYTRFLDLQKAEAQAREAQIEVSLERVRASAMAMHDSEDLANTIKVFYQQVGLMSETPRRCGIDIIDRETHSVEISSMNTTEQGNPLEAIGKILLKGHRVLEGIYDNWLLQKEYYPTLKGDEIKEYYDFVRPHIGYPDYKQDEAHYGHFFPFPEGCIYVWTTKELSEDELKIYRRFTSVLSLTYKRYKDLLQAEAQARESQIQLALERVRARTMAMQRSDELSETVFILFQQFKQLGENPDQATIGIINEEEWVIEYWVTMYGSQTNRAFKFPIDEPNVTNRIYKAWKEEKKSLVIELSGKELYDFATFRESMGGAAFNAEEKKRVINVAFFSKGLINVQSNEFRSEESIRLLERFAAVFEQTYTRFLDLQKAESQAREAEIELGLERVRARGMAMQKSSELAQLVDTVFKELTKLHVLLDRCIIMIYDPKTNGSTWWLATPEPGSVPVGLFVKYNEYQPNLDYIKAWKARTLKWEYVLEGTNKKEWDNFLFNETELSRLPALVIDGMMSYDRIFLNVSFNNFGCLTVSSAEPLPKEQFDVLLRFAKVFDSTYTRFNDLKQVEAQAREARIEAALEKVRSRSMAMHKSEELRDVVKVVFDKLQELNFVLDDGAVSILIFKDGSNDHTQWIADPDHLYATSFDIAYTDHSISADVINVKKSGVDYFSKTYPTEEKNEYFKYLFAHTDYKHLPGEVKNLILGSEQYGLSVAFAKNSAIVIPTNSGKLLGDEEREILKRFVKVFDQAYTRFLDLQKAEAQAREARIEAALEKIRSRSLGMHRSVEIKDVVAILFEKLKELDLVFDGGAAIHLFTEGSRDAVIWVASPLAEPSCVNLPYEENAFQNNPIIMDVWHAKETGEHIYNKFYSFEEKNRYFDYVFKHNDFIAVPQPVREFIPQADSYTASFIAEKNSLLGANSWTRQLFSESDFDILKRIARVFEQAYIRFLDLQKAEAQVREAKIEAALEKVRSRTMAMQRSDELANVATVLFQQVKALGVPQWTCGFSIFEIDDKEFTWYPGSADGDILPPVKIPLTEHPVFISFNDSRKRGDELFIYEKEGEYQAGHYRYMRSLPGGEEMYQNTLKAGLTLPTFQIDHLANFSHGNLMFITYEPFPEMHDVFKRFAKVFEQTYTRFLDLQRAEAQVLETVKRASVDRVRAEIASMRTTNDLERITPLIWNELTTLGVPFIRCGVFIMDEEKQLVETHLSTPDGKAIATFTSTFSGTKLIIEVLPYWRRKEIYKAHWDEAAFLEQAKSLVQQGSITSGEKYLTENRPTDLYLHFLPFLQGMLYVGNSTSLSNDELQLVQNLADAFSTAYARYEDFNKLESAKEQIEKTLVDLKQAQAQLVQSAKMASLGELTAGIAHEIQNPLNFVNNFSEVNQELIDELKNEKVKPKNERDEQLETELLNDIAENSEKINHHGKRADAIVKGMLQHSRSSNATKEPTDINTLADEYLRLAYHGLRAKDKSFNATLKTNFDGAIGNINVIAQDIGRVILNLITNAFYATNEKSKQPIENLPAGQAGYDPTVVISTKKADDSVSISVKDNGNGISQKVVDKIFQPFFTTKPTGQGTGLGLSLAYDIIKAHGGEIKVETKEGEGSEFIILLPVV